MFEERGGVFFCIAEWLGQHAQTSGAVALFGGVVLFRTSIKKIINYTVLCL